MKSPQSEASNSPEVHSQNIQRELSQLIEHLEADVRRVNDRRFQGLLEKSTEVLKGLRTLFERFGAAGRAAGDKPAASGRADKKSAGAVREPAPAAKAGSTAKPASRTKSAPAVSARDTAKSSPARGDVRPAPSNQSAQKKTTGAQPPQSGAAATPGLGTPVPKPQDPDEIAAKARLQRQEARSPKMPGGHAAPKPMPPRSGKPVWAKPHSS